MNAKTAFGVAAAGLIGWLIIKKTSAAPAPLPVTTPSGSGTLTTTTTSTGSNTTTAAGGSPAGTVTGPAPTPYTGSVGTGGSTIPSLVNFQLIVNVAGGTGTVTPDGGTFASGTQVQLTATPTGLSAFYNWTISAPATPAAAALDNAVWDTDNPTSVVMNGNVNLTANFRTVRASPGANYQDTSSPYYVALMAANKAEQAAMPAFQQTQAAWYQAGQPDPPDPTAVAYMAAYATLRDAENAYNEASYAYQVYNGLPTD